MRRAIWFAFGSSGAIAVALLVFWLANGFARVGLDTNIVIALALGILFSILLGVGLMTLVFYSDRSGQDDQVHQAHPREDTDRH
jgi:hypothetical protein